MSDTEPIKEPVPVPTQRERFEAERNRSEIKIISSGTPYILARYVNEFMATEEGRMYYLRGPVTPWVDDTGQTKYFQVLQYQYTRMAN